MANIDTEKKELATYLLKSLKNEFGNSWFDNSIQASITADKYDESIYASLLFDEGLKAEYCAWSTGPHYIIMWYGSSKIVVEIDLSKIVKINQLYTWYLPRPRNKDNEPIYRRLFKETENIPENIRDRIRSDKKKLEPKKRLSIDKKGYLVVKDASIEKLTKTFLVLSSMLVSNYKNQGHYKARISYMDADSAMEGYKRENDSMRNSRNASIVKRRKQLDKNTCQVCGFKFQLEDKYVIECHHLNPFAEGPERLTNIEEIVCLCPNCHRMIHMRKPVYTLKELKKLIMATK